MSGHEESTRNRILTRLGKAGWRSFGPEAKLAFAGGPRTFGEVIRDLLDAGIVEQRNQSAEQIVEYRLVRPAMAVPLFEFDADGLPQ